MSKRAYITIQKEVLADITALNLTPVKRDNCIKFVNILTTRAFRETNSIFCSNEIPKSFLTKAFTSEYHKFLTPLKESGIIISNESYDTTRGICKSYMLNPKYITNDAEMVGVTVKVKERETTKKSETYKDQFRDDLKTLKIDYDRLYQIIDETILNLSIDAFLVGSAIPEDNYEYIIRTGGKERTGYISLKKAMQVADEHNVSVILNKKKVHIIDECQFINMKSASIRLSYTDSVNKLNKGFYFADRNTTNNRLDTNFTNFCNKLLQPIIEDNNLIQLDLANSQFTFFAHATRDVLTEEDGVLFRELAVKGQLYEYIQEKLNLATRKDAKRVTIELLFGSEKYQSKNLKALKTYFPTVIAYINNFKKENGKANFAISLQKEESNLFIDTLHKELKKKKLFCITRHDSLIVRKENEQEVREFVQMIFDSIGFEGTIS